MSFYGAKTFRGLFSAHKQRLAGNASYRFGGAHHQVAYDTVSGAEVPVTLHSSGVNVIAAGENDVVSVVLMGLSPTAPATFSDVSFLDVNGPAVLAANQYGLVLEGSVAAGDETLDAETDIHLVQPEASISGNAKLVVFGYQQN